MPWESYKFSAPQWNWFLFTTPKLWHYLLAFCRKELSIQWSTAMSLCPGSKPELQQFSRRTQKSCVKKGRNLKQTIFHLDTYGETDESRERWPFIAMKSATLFRKQLNVALSKEKVLQYWFKIRFLKVPVLWANSSRLISTAQLLTHFPSHYQEDKEQEKMSKKKSKKTCGSR